MSPAEAAVTAPRAHARGGAHLEVHRGEVHLAGPPRTAPPAPVLRAAPRDLPAPAPADTPTAIGTITIGAPTIEAASLGPAAAAPDPGRARATPVPVAEPHPLLLLPRAQPAPAGQDELPLRTAAPALRSVPSPGTRTAPAPSPRERTGSVRSLPGVRRALREADPWSPQPTSTTELPDAEQLCATLARAVVEVHAGVRPASQLLRWFTADLYASLQRRAALGARLRRDGSAARRVAVRRVAVCEPRDGVVEASVVLQDHERVRAVALRLEGWDGRWRVTHLEVG